MTQKKRTLVASVAVLLCLVLLIGASLAWTDFSQSKTNRFRGTVDPDVTLHDEFDGENKDIFVENSGSQTLYVRVRLDEYMEVGGESFDPSASVKDKTTWNPHYWPQDGNVANCNCLDDGNPLHKFHRYYTWSVTGAQRNYREGTPGLVYTKLGADGKVDLATDSTLKTQAAIAPVTMAQYITAKTKYDRGETLQGTDAHVWESVEAGCWILDSDGWAYWSQPLLAGTATNMLLDEVVFDQTVRPDDDWYYGIDVKLQAVTANDFAKWDDAANKYTKTANADKLIETWQAV